MVWSARVSSVNLVEVCVPFEVGLFVDVRVYTTSSKLAAVRDLQ
jgi:hypothetical protein